MLEIIFVLILILLVAAIYGSCINKSWGHKVFGWHYVTTKIGFDGASLTGVCDKCGKPVLQDSQGNWF